MAWKFFLVTPSMRPRTCAASEFMVRTRGQARRPDRETGERRKSYGSGRQQCEAGTTRDDKAPLRRSTGPQPTQGTKDESERARGTNQEDDKVDEDEDEKPPPPPNVPRATRNKIENELRCFPLLSSVAPVALGTESLGSR